MKTLPERANVSELARLYATSRNTARFAIERAGLQADAAGKYGYWEFENAVATHCPKLAEDTGSDAGLWREYLEVDAQRLRCRLKLQERGYDMSAKVDSPPQG